MYIESNECKFEKGLENLDTATFIKVQKDTTSLFTEKQIITLYVGRLTEEFRNDLFQVLLMKCGKVVSWRRAKHSCGFVDYKEPEGALRCISVMNGLRIKDRTILVTADATIIRTLKKYENGLKTKRFPLSKLYDPRKKEQKEKSVEQRLVARDAACLLEIQQLLQVNDLTPMPNKSAVFRRKSIMKETKYYEGSLLQQSKIFCRKVKQHSHNILKQKLEEKNINESDEIILKQKLISLIPRNERDTFTFLIDWNFISKSKLAENIMRPWIKARLLEYLDKQNVGRITNFIIDLLKKETKPDKLINQLSMSLGKDCRSFVVKMWRRLIFETMKAKLSLK